MQAILKIRRNQAVGYSLRVTLPQAWCRRFQWSDGMRVYGERLTATWGHPLNDGHDRSKSAIYDSLESAQAAMQIRKAEIESARRYLMSPKEIDCTYTIDLGGDND